jgi:hypothetical protein
MAAKTASLGGLPDELVLEILNHFHTIRSYETQSTAFKDQEKERTRQSENRILKRSLRNLCLTSRHVSRIATPILYASFTGAVTRHGLTPLNLFHERTSASHVPGRKCIEYLQYVEVRLEDDQGNSLRADTLEPDAVYQAAYYFQLLAHIISCAPNLQHLSLVVLETDNVSFWKHIITEEDATAALTQTTATRQDFHKLQTLCIQMHIDVSINHSSGSFDQICSVMSRAPVLSDFRAHGVATFALPAQPTELSIFCMLKRLEITECMLEIEEVAKVLSACNELQHVVCTWAFLDDTTGTIPDLFIALLHHTETLESLRLDLRQVRTDEDLDESQCFGSFLPFKTLKTLAVSDYCLPAFSNLIHEERTHCYDKTVPPPLMAELLPPSLTSFTMLTGEPDEISGESSDLSPDLWVWVKKYASSGLNLKHFIVESYDVEIENPSITKAFLDLGVQFELKEVSAYD